MTNIQPTTKILNYKTISIHLKIFKNLKYHRWNLLKVHNIYVNVENSSNMGRAWLSEDL